MNVFFVLICIKATTNSYTPDFCANDNLCLPEFVRFSLVSLPVQLSFLRYTNIEVFLNRLKQNKFRPCEYLESFIKDFESMLPYLIVIDTLYLLDLSTKSINKESIGDYISIYNKLEIGTISLTYMRMFLECYTPIVLDDIEDIHARETGKILTKRLLDATHVYSSAYYHFRTIYFYFKSIENKY